MVCEFHGSNGNGFGDIWWTDNPIYFSSIDYCVFYTYAHMFSCTPAQQNEYVACHSRSPPCFLLKLCVH